MFKKTALIVLLLGSLAAPLAWGQDDPDSEDALMQADDEWAGEGDESAAEAGEAEFVEETDANDSFDEESAADETAEAVFTDDSQLDESLDEDSASDESADIAADDGTGASPHPDTPRPGLPRAPSMDMNIAGLPGPVTYVRLAGRMDAVGADLIGLRFTTAVTSSARPVVVDLSGVDFVDSMGLRLMISAARGLGLKGHRMAVFGAQPLVQSVLEDAAIDQLMPVTATQDEALAAVR